MNTIPLLALVAGVVVGLVGGYLLRKAIKLPHPTRLYALLGIIFVSMLPRVAFDLFDGGQYGSIGDVIYSLCWMLTIAVVFLWGYRRPRR